MLALESGNWAEWVGAIGTVLAFMAAAIAFAYNLYATRRDSLKAQAVQFDAWVKYVESPSNAEEFRKPCEEGWLPLRVTVEFPTAAIRRSGLNTFGSTRTTGALLGRSAKHRRSRLFHRRIVRGPKFSRSRFVSDVP
jgi:hypothetical protein